MAHKDKAPQRKIALSHAFIVFAILTAAVGGGVLYVKHRNNYYEALAQEGRDIVNDSDPLTPTVIVPVDSTLPVVTVDSATPVKLIFYSETNQKVSIKYYSNGIPRVISYLDEAEKVVRQDFLDTKGRIRIRLYYNSNGDLVQKEYYDENNNRIDQHIYLPVGGGRTGY